MSILHGAQINPDLIHVFIPRQQTTIAVINLAALRVKGMQNISIVLGLLTKEICFGAVLNPCYLHNNGKRNKSHHSSQGLGTSRILLSHCKPREGDLFSSIQSNRHASPSSAT